MAKFNLSITAHVGNEVMLIWSKDFDRNIMERTVTGTVGPVLDRLLTLMTCADWQPDDGDDIPGTTYCQYAHYEKDNQANYLIGVWCEVDEQTGCMKL